MAVLAVVVCVLRNGIQSDELPYTLASSGADIVLRTSEFEIVFRDCGPGRRFESRGAFQIGGPGHGTGTSKCGTFELRHSYHPSALRLTFKMSSILVVREGGEIRLVVNGSVLKNDFLGSAKPVIIFSESGEVLTEN